MRKLFLTIGVAGCVLVLASCSQPPNASVDVQRTIELDTISVGENAPESYFTVVDDKGQTVELKLEDGPVLFLAHWCPHCNRYLETHEPLPDLRVVAVYPRDGETRDGETVEEMMNGVRAKLNQAGWEDVPLYGSIDPDIVEGVPTIAYMVDNMPFHKNAYEVGEGDL